MSALTDVTDTQRCPMTHDGYQLRCTLPDGHHGCHEAEAGRFSVIWRQPRRTA